MQASGTVKCRTFKTASGECFEGVFLSDDATGKTVEAYQMTTGNTDKKPFLLCAPISVVAVYSDSNGDNFGRVVEFENERGVMQRRYIDAANSEADVAKILKSAGLKIYCLTRPNYRACLNQLIFSYPVDGLPMYLNFPRPGWIPGQEGKAFLLPSGEFVGSSAEIPLLKNADLKKAAWKRGDLGDWFRLVGSVAVKAPAMVAAIGFSLIGPLMPLVGMTDTCFLHFKGPSKKGKSNAARVAVSLWGSAAMGADGCGLMRSWKTTETALEIMLENGNHAVLSLDELGVSGAQEKRNISSLVYLASQGSSKGRGNAEIQLREPKKWLLPVISTGEIDLQSLDKTAQLEAGVYGRFAMVDACIPGGFGVFGPGACSSNADAVLLADQIKTATERKAFGTVGPKFVSALVADIEQRGGIEPFKEHLQEQMREVLGSLTDSGDSQITDMAKRFALSEIALKMAVQCGALPECFTAQAIHSAVSWAFGSASENFVGSEKEAEEYREAIFDLYPQNSKRFHVVIGCGDGAGRPMYIPAPDHYPAGYAFFERGGYCPDDHLVRNFYQEPLAPNEIYVFMDSRVAQDFFRGREPAKVFQMIPLEFSAGDTGRPFRKKFKKGQKLKGIVPMPGKRLLAFKLQ